MEDANPSEMTSSQILVYRRAKYGCPEAWSFELGQEEAAQRIRDDHERWRCFYRHLSID